MFQIRTGRGKSLESLEDPNERTHHTFSADNTQTFYYQQQGIGWRPRSYDDGDITPTNESGLLYEGGGTLPRPRGVIRPRPIAKIAAKARETFPDFEKPQFNTETYAGAQYKTLPRDMINTSKWIVFIMIKQGTKLVFYGSAHAIRQPPDGKEDPPESAKTTGQCGRRRRTEHDHRRNSSPPSSPRADVQSATSARLSQFRQFEHIAWRARRFAAAAASGPRHAARPSKQWLQAQLVSVMGSRGAGADQDVGTAAQERFWCQF